MPRGTWSSYFKCHACHATLLCTIYINGEHKPKFFEHFADGGHDGEEYDGDDGDDDDDYAEDDDDDGDDDDDDGDYDLDDHGQEGVEHAVVVCCCC